MSSWKVCYAINLCTSAGHNLHWILFIVGVHHLFMPQKLPFIVALCFVVLINSRIKNYLKIFATSTPRSPREIESKIITDDAVWRVIWQVSKYIYDA